MTEVWSLAEAVDVLRMLPIGQAHPTVLAAFVRLPWEAEPKQIGQLTADDFRRMAEELG